MNPPHSKGFWSQLSTFSKVLILLLILGISGSLIAYMYQQETEVITSSTATDDEIVAASENESESVVSATTIAPEPETKEAPPTVVRKDSVKLFSKETHKRIKNLVQKMAKQAEAHPQDKEKTN
ncbi:hypothetical protein P1X15_02160 [Runella sp. MFBS21]|uniref:hypothetical protein n=1 Tax=Runella sp. MFBS21 TaxID=3034018 RepID=UPI0023F7FFF5|nr:hypothetical protein [Runella sp. MFBS21]MDF7816372.1 hypothetical protein [Runella sp. MFBS21]